MNRYSTSIPTFASLFVRRWRVSRGCAAAAILLTVLAPTAVAAQSPDRPEDLAAYEANTSWDRKISLSPSRAQGGIDRGCVIAYGHLLPGPFEIVERDSAVFVNGIQVQPSLIAQRESQPISVTPVERASAEKRIKVRDQVRAHFDRISRKSSAQGTREAITSYAKTLDGVKDAEWKHSRLMLTFADAGRMAISFDSSRAPISQGARPSPSTSILRLMKSILASGDCLLLTSEGLIKDIPDRRTEVRTIMLGRGGRSEKIENLKKTLGSYDAALDVFANFVELEWKPGR